MLELKHQTFAGTSRKPLNSVMLLRASSLQSQACQCLFQDDTSPFQILSKLCSCSHARECLCMHAVEHSMVLPLLKQQWPAAAGGAIREPHFINDHDNVVLIAMLSEGRQKVWGRGHKAPLPQDGFNDDGCCVLWGGLHLQHPLEGIMWAPAAPPRLVLIKWRYAG